MVPVPILRKPPAKPPPIMAVNDVLPVLRPLIWVEGEIMIAETDGALVILRKPDDDFP